MISIQKQFLFIHIPKTGGNSLQNILRFYSEDNVAIVQKAHDDPDGIERFGARNNKYKTGKHSPLSEYHLRLPTDIYSSLFKFAIMRNPWDRMISYYFSPHRGVNQWNRSAFLALINRAFPLRYYICEQPTTEDISGDSVFNTNKKALDLDKDIDFLIRFENLEHDFKKVCEKIDIPYSKLPNRNRSEHLPYRNYYDEELKQIIFSKFKEEIRYGNYTL